MRKPTMQTIADEAGVSRITVWKVMNNREGVSPVLKKQILETAGRLGYPVREDMSPEFLSMMRGGERTYTLSVIVSHPRSSSFWMNVIHEIAREMDRQDYLLTYTYVPRTISDDYKLPTHLLDGSVDGIFVLNVYDEKLTALLNDLDTPKVFLDVSKSFPINELRGDLITLDGLHTIKEITDTMIQGGRKRIAFIGDTKQSFMSSIRYDGYVQSLADNHIPLDENYCLVTSVTDNCDYRTRIIEFLKKLPVMADGIVCANDLLANCAYRFLLDNGYRVPEDVTLSGYNNIQEYISINHMLTTAEINIPLLGKRLVLQLKNRIEHPELRNEFILISPEIIYRKSTDTDL